MGVLIALSALLLLSQLRVAAALYAKGGEVLLLDDRTFASAVEAAPGVAAVEFYAPWCGHCQALAPHWKKTAANLAGLATVAAVDCDDRSNAALCSRFGITGFPTIKLFGPQQDKNPYTGALSKEAADYTGPRTAKAIVDAIKARLTDVHVARPDSASALQAWLNDGGTHPKVVLLSEKSEVTTLYRALSTQLHAEFAFAQVHAPSAPGAAALLGLAPDAELPALAIKVPGQDAPRHYSGPLKALDLLAFLKALISEGGVADTAGQAPADDAPLPADLEQLSWADLAALDRKEDMALVVVQVAAGDGAACERQARAVAEAVSRELQGSLRFVLARGTPEDLPQVSRYSLDTDALIGEAERSGCGTRLVLLPFGADKEDLEEYQVYPPSAVLPDGKALAKWVTGHVPGLFAIEVTPGNLQPFVSAPAPKKRDGSETTDPDGSEEGDEEEEDEPAEEVEEGSVAALLGGRRIAPKVVLVTLKEEVPPVFRALAMSLRANPQGALFGWVRAGDPANKQVLEAFRPQKTPGLMVLAPIPQEVPGPDGKPGLQMAMASQTYKGPTTLRAMREWVVQMLAIMEELAGNAPGSSQGKAVPQVATDGDFEEHCVSKGAGVCVIALLDGSRARRLKSGARLLGKVAARYDGQPLHFSWADAAKLRGFAAGLGVQMGSDLPALAVLSASRGRAAVMPSRFTSEKEATAFIDGVLGGRVTTHVLEDGLPHVTSSSTHSRMGGVGTDHASQQDVEQVAEEVVTEEFDLSEVLSEEVEAGPGTAAERLARVEAELAAEAAARAQQEAEAPTRKKRKKKSKAKAKAKVAGGGHQEL